MTKATTLAGTKVVVTRPAKQAGILCDLIERYGGQAIRFASLEITEPADSAAINRLLDRIDTYDIAIFVSRNAVEGAARLLSGAIPESLTLMAVGKASARAVEQQWQRPATSPTEGANSEGLLKTEVLQNVDGRNIIIFRGQGGRELLGETLQQRGASVDYAEVYRRVRPDHDLTALIHSDADVITATSNESLQNLFEMATAPQREWLRTRQLIVLSQRGAHLAHKFGFHHPAIIAPTTDDPGLLDAILEWRLQKHN